MKFAALTLIVMSVCGLGACTGAYYGPPNEYATAPRAWVDNKFLVRHNPYNRVVANDDEARGGFLAVLQESCADVLADGQTHGWTETSDCEKNPGADDTTFKCWAADHQLARRCVDAVALHAVDQCVSKAGGQNYFTAKANVVLGSILSAANAGAAGAAIANPGDNSSVPVALAANLASGANNARGFAPATVTVKVGDFAAAEQAYVVLAGFRNGELKRLQDFHAATVRVTLPGTGRLETNEEYDARLSDGYHADLRKDPVVLKYSRLHDAVYAVCPVAAY